MELLTFFLGLVTAIIGYLISNFVLKPFQDYKKLRAKIGNKLTYYSHIITSPGGGPLANEAYPVLRGLACDLESVYLLIPFRWVFIWTGLVPNETEVMDTKGHLIFLSNSLGNGERSDVNLTALEKIFTLLNIKELSSRHNLEPKRPNKLKLKLRDIISKTPTWLDKVFKPKEN